MVDGIIRTRPKADADDAFKERHYPDFDDFLKALHSALDETDLLHIEVVEADTATARQRQIIKDLGVVPVFWR